ncbi:phosphotransferase [Patescibacteria group bacterium]|nr:phosphotransferase [Patescibacteria group bacterium]MBU1755313.1 phosphotransferase [Patescibacteria group bacterium]
MDKFPKPPIDRPAKTIEEMENEIDSLLLTLPLPIRERWESENESLSTNHQLSSLKQFIEKRRLAVIERADTSITEKPSHVAVEHSYPLAIAKLIESVESEEHNLLGSGMAGRVVASIRQPAVCYKVMYPKEKLPAGTNSVTTEADIQDKIYNLGPVAGVHVPRVHVYVEDEHAHAIRMETIIGCSLRDILHGRAEWPETFDFESFFTSLEQFVEHMHENGYHHRDLHDGNVMIDYATGQPRVIDFGYAKRGDDYDNIYRQNVIEAGQIKELVLPSDLGSLQSLKKMVRTASLQHIKKGV